MAIRLFKAYSPGTRAKAVSYFSDLSFVKSLKALTSGKKNCNGRNNFGVITVRGRGGGHKKKYRRIDFYENLPLLLRLLRSNMIQIEL